MSGRDPWGKARRAGTVVRPSAAERRASTLARTRETAERARSEGRDEVAALFDEMADELEAAAS